MSISDLRPEETDVIRQCLKAAVDGPFFDEPEFHTLFGLERADIGQILNDWPRLDDSDRDVHLAINNTFANLLYYPHRRETEWPKYISVSAGEVKRIFKKWRGFDEDV